MERNAPDDHVSRGPSSQVVKSSLVAVRITFVAHSSDLVLTMVSVQLKQLHHM